MLTINFWSNRLWIDIFIRINDDYVLAYLIYRWEILRSFQWNWSTKWWWEVDMEKKKKHWSVFTTIGKWRLCQYRSCHYIYFRARKNEHYLYPQADGLIIKCMLYLIVGQQDYIFYMHIYSRKMSCMFKTMLTKW